MEVKKKLTEAAMIFIKRSRKHIRQTAKQVRNWRQSSVSDDRFPGDCKQTSSCSLNTALMNLIF